MINRTLLSTSKVIEWMQENHHSREWLSEKLGVKTSSVKTYLAKPQLSLSHSQAVITLMELDKALFELQSPPVQHLHLEFSMSEYNDIALKALNEGLTVRRWAENTLFESSKE